ncbi:MAG: hypothetical protein QOH93_1239 [Chloroflexia bacterium]|jgi:hypothetical protein|nr:hypothetical protein [Chloroflexia bacterium]
MSRNSRRNGTSPTVQPVARGGETWLSTQGWKERAQAALVDKNRAATDEWAKNEAKLAALMQSVVGVDIEGLPIEKPGDSIVLDGVRFRMIEYGEPTGDQLVILRACGSCGKPTPSGFLKTPLDVGEAMEEWEPKCRDCQKGAIQPEHSQEVS